MLTPDEIKMGLEFCSRRSETLTACKQCPYTNVDDGCYEVLRDALDYIKNLEGDVKFYQNLYNVHADTIDFHEQYEKQLEQRLVSVGKTCPEWISVEDRPPEGQVLVANFAPGTEGYKEMDIGYVEVYEMSDAESPCRTVYDKTGFDIWYNITHWMPLPNIPIKKG